MTAQVIWRPEGLTRALYSAFRLSVIDAKAVADRLNPAPSKIKVVAVQTGIGGSPSALLKGVGKLAHIFEGGRKGGYIIQPGLRTTTRATKTAAFGKVTAGKSANVAIKFTRGDQGFFRGAGFKGGAMKARPYIHPAATAWAHGLYQRRAASAAASWGTGALGQLGRLAG